MTEIRCVKCRRLLFKQEGIFGKIEIKCPKCGYKYLHDPFKGTCMERINPIVKNAPLIK